MTMGANDTGDGTLQAHRAHALQTVTAGLSSAATRAEILESIIDEGGRVLGSSAAVAYQIADDRQTLVLVAHHGLTKTITDTLAGLTLASSFPVAVSMRQGEPVWLSSQDAIARDFPQFERTVRDAFAWQALVGLPLRVRGDVVAGIGFALREPHVFDESERQFLLTLAERCESALERALLYEESQRARAAAEQSRAEAEALVRFSEMVSGILAHDLRNPLAAVLMNARLLRSAERDREKTIGKRIEASGERMSRMIEQILDWTRARSNGDHFQLARGACDLGALADEAVREHAVHQPEAAIALDKRGPLTGNWDADRLAQMLSNLIGNAIDHATSPGVRVRLDGDGGAVVVTVENAGEIPDDVLPTVFEPFRGRAAGARTRGRGLGLGLYITRQIVIAHGGTIDVSRSDGRVTFTVTLPR